MNHVRNCRIDRFRLLRIVVVELVFALRYPIDEVRLTSAPKVWENRVRGNHFAHRDIVYAECDCRSLGKVTGESSVVPHVANATYSNLLSNSNRRNVERHLECFAHSHRSPKLPV